jgi:hypothetical protein
MAFSLSSVTLGAAIGAITANPSVAAEAEARGLEKSALFDPQQIHTC